MEGNRIEKECVIGFGVSFAFFLAIIGDLFQELVYTSHVGSIKA